MNVEFFFLAATALLMSVEMFWRYRKRPQKHIIPLILSFLLVIVLAIMDNHALSQKAARILSIVPQLQIITTVPFWTAWACNLLVLLFFIIVKGIVLLMFKRINALLPAFLKEHMPGYDFYKGSFCLKHGLRGAHRIIFSFAVAYALFLLITIALGFSGMLLSGMFLLWAPFYILILELAFYLGGPIWSLAENDGLIVDQPGIQHIQMYDVIYHKFHKYFSDLILASRIYSKHFQPSALKKVSEYLGEGDVLVSDIYNDHIQAVFDDLFRDFLRRGTQILVITATNEQLTEAHQALEGVLAAQHSNDLVVDTELIRARLWARMKNCDFIFMLAEHLEEIWHSDELENALPYLQLIVVPYAATQPPSSFVLLQSIFKNKLTSGQVRLLILSEKLYNIEECVGRQFNSDSIREVQACSLSDFDRYLIIWEADPDKFYHSHLVTGVDYIPPPSVLSVVPLSTGMDKIYWARVDNFDKDSYETLQGHLDSNCIIDEFRNTRIDPGRMILYSNLMLFRGTDKRFLFLFDHACNLPYLLEQIDKHHDISHEFLNILSSKYLLRAYFLKNLEFFLSHPFSEKLSPALTWPQYSVKAKLFSLLNTLLHESNGLPVERIANEYFSDHEYWSAIFKAPENQQISRQYLLSLCDNFPETRDLAANLVESFRWDPDQRKTALFIDLKGTDKPIRFESAFSFIIEDTNKEILTDPNITEDNLVYKIKIGDQLSGQYSAEGNSSISFYEVRKIDPRNHKILVSRDNPNEPKSHRCSIQLEIDTGRASKLAQSRHLKSGLSHSQWSLFFTRKITHTLEFPNHSGICLPSAQIHSKSDSLFPVSLLERNYSFVPALKYQLAFGRDLLEADRIDRVAYTLSIVIKEVFVSLFPYTCRQLHVYSPQSEAALASTTGDVRDYLRLLYPAVTGLPESGEGGDDGAPISIWILEESQIGLGVVQFLDSDKNSQRVWEVVHDYLEFKCSAEGNEDDYLFFGVDASIRDTFPYDFEGASLVAAKMVASPDTCLNRERATWSKGDNIELRTNRYDPLQIVCDFCGARLGDQEHESFHDGRIICQACAASAVIDPEELRKIKENVRKDILSLYRISIPQVEVTEFRDAHAIHAELGQSFHPTHDYDVRAVGLTIVRPANNRMSYRILIENGSPRMSIYLTIAHELTHIWQYVHLILPDDTLFPKYILEGHATFIEYQMAKYWLQQGTAPELETVVRNLEARASSRSDEYGQGLAHFLETVNSKQNPFAYMRDRQQMKG